MLYETHKFFEKKTHKTKQKGVEATHFLSYEDFERQFFPNLRKSKANHIHTDVEINYSQGLG